MQLHEAGLAVLGGVGKAGETPLGGCRVVYKSKSKFLWTNLRALIDTAYGILIAKVANIASGD